MKKNTYLKEAQGDGVRVVVMEVDDEEEGEVLVKLMPLWCCLGVDSWGWDEEELEEALALVKWKWKKEMKCKGKV